MPWVDRVVSRHPRIRVFLARRLDAHVFEGLPFTILCVSLVLIFVFLGGVIEDYLTNDTLVLLDARLTNLLYTFRTEGALKFFYFLTLFCEASVVVVVAVVASVFLWKHRYRIYVPGLWTALGIGEGLAILGKLAFQRPRPDVMMRAITETSFSFPSGHASTVVPLYGYFVYLLLKSKADVRTKRLAIAGFVVLVLLIDFSRLYLGVHYLSDVIAGNLIGLIGLIVAIGITEWMIARRTEIRMQVTKFSPIVGGLCVALFGAAVLYAASPVQISSRELPDMQDIHIGDVSALFEGKVLPRFTETITGAYQEPISLVVIAPKECFVADVAKAGWVLADDVTWKSTARFLKDATLDKTYPTAPMTPSFFDAEPHDYGFQKPTEENSIRARHHARFWDTNYETPFGELYLGTVSLDVDTKWGGITHRIAPDIDSERDVFVSDFINAGIVVYSTVFQFVPPTLGENFAGDPFFTSGQAAFVVLTPCGK
ncbi:MAG: phosphatase PAP2 family protein [Candidatus Yonathbacteria bacterium]|nr:phosphatase PAP2 family protein [Candidatus Yonathbacteria bacterium]